MLKIFIKKFAVLSSCLSLFACAPEPNCKCSHLCVYPGVADVEAPEWICGADIHGYPVTALGQADAQKAAISTSFAAAFAIVYAKLALRQELVNVTALKLKHYIQFNYDIADASQIDVLVSSLKNAKESIKLSKARKLKQQPGPLGNIYVLMGLDAEAANEAIFSLIKISFEKNAEFWHLLGKELNPQNVLQAITSAQY